MYRPYTVLKSVWLNLTPFPLCNLEGHVMQNAVEASDVKYCIVFQSALAAVLYSLHEGPRCIDW